MIVKQIESQTRETNYFQALVAYLLNPQGKEHRVGRARLSNYISEDVAGARFETQVLQKQNTRAKSSDTMHLVISFPEGEIPSKEVLEQIEDRMATSLGMQDHQRISVTHSDTDHFHLHIAINKVHPVSHNLISPAFSWTALSKCALQCEQDFHLSHDNHVIQRVLYVDGQPTVENYEPDDSYIKNQKARDMEYKEGLESVTRLLKTEMLQPLLEAKNWQEFHGLLKDKGLLIQIRGNGFVFKTDDDTIAVKASAVSRNLSFEKLSKRLGPFETLDLKPKDESKWKKKGPSALYLRYLDERNALWTARKVNARDEAFRAREEAKSRYRMALASLNNQRNRLTREYLRAKAFEIYQKELEQIAEMQKKTYAQFQKEKPLGWKAWVQKRALEGDVEALIALRNKDARLRKALSLRTEEPCKLLLESLEKDSVTKAGTIIYRCGETTLKDCGQSLIVSNEYERTALRETLVATKEKFGGSALIVNGTDEFKNDLLVVAASMKTVFRFQDAKLQASYEKLKEIENEKRNARNRRTHNGSDSQRRGGSGLASELVAELPDDLAKLPDESIARVLLAKSEEEMHRDAMLKMPESDLGREGEFGLLQVPSVVRSDLYEPETEQHVGVRHLSQSDERERERRRVCVKTYVESRNAKREFASSILEHRPYSVGLKTGFVYKGMRHLDGVAMVLLEIDKTIYVKDVPNSQVNFLKTLALDTPVQVEQEQIKVVEARKRK